MEKTKKFSFPEGEIINGKYEVLEFLGSGWEGEVYLVNETQTSIERAVKFFYPQKNQYGRKSKYYAKKLHKLRNCSAVIQYATQDTIFIKDEEITFLVSEYMDGELLSEYLKRQHHRKLHYFEALHLLHALAKGIDEIHQKKEYHGDLHTDNIIVEKKGIGFKVKVLDLFHWGSTSAEHIRDDVVNLIHIFHEILGGKKDYAKLPKEIRAICCGLKRSLIFQKYKTAGKLKEYLESIEWE